MLRVSPVNTDGGRLNQMLISYLVFQEPLNSHQCTLEIMFSECAETSPASEGKTCLCPNSWIKKTHNGLIRILPLFCTESMFAVCFSSEISVMESWLVFRKKTGLVPLLTTNVTSQLLHCRACLGHSVELSSFAVNIAKTIVAAIY